MISNQKISFVPIVINGIQYIPVELAQNFATSSNSLTSNKKKQLPKRVRDLVWSKWIGSDKMIGKCFCCKNDIKNNNYHCGHVIAYSNGGSNEIDNLRPLCSQCNLSMGDKNMFEFIEDFGFWYQPINIEEIKKICDFLGISKFGNKKDLIKNIKSFNCNDQNKMEIKNMFVEFGETESKLLLDNMRRKIMEKDQKEQLLETKNTLNKLESVDINTHNFVEEKIVIAKNMHNENPDSVKIKNISVNELNKGKDVLLSKNSKGGISNVSNVIENGKKENLISAIIKLSDVDINFLQKMSYKKLEKFFLDLEIKYSKLIPNDVMVLFCNYFRVETHSGKSRKIKNVIFHLVEKENIALLEEIIEYFQTGSISLYKKIKNGLIECCYNKLKKDYKLILSKWFDCEESQIPKYIFLEWCNVLNSFINNHHDKMLAYNRVSIHFSDILETLVNSAVEKWEANYDNGDEIKFILKFLNIKKEGDRSNINYIVQFFITKYNKKEWLAPPWHKLKLFIETRSHEIYTKLIDDILNQCSKNNLNNSEILQNYLKLSDEYQKLCEKKIYQGIVERECNKSYLVSQIETYLQNKLNKTPIKIDKNSLDYYFNITKHFLLGESSETCSKSDFEYKMYNHNNDLISCCYIEFKKNHSDVNFKKLIIWELYELYVSGLYCSGITNNQLKEICNILDIKKNCNKMELMSNIVIYLLDHKMKRFLPHFADCLLTLDNGKFPNLLNRLKKHLH